MKLILLRHGRTEANERRLYCGVSDVPLSSRGREELLELKGRVAYPDTNGLQLVTSGMKRTDETLELLFGAQPDVRERGFCEMNFGRFDMHSYDELKNDADYQAWIMNENGTIPTPGGESSVQFHKRVFAAADALHGDALVVCHGGVIAALMQRWFPDEGKNMYQWQPDSGQGYCVALDSGRNSYVCIARETSEL